MDDKYEKLLIREQEYSQSYLNSVDSIQFLNFKHNAKIILSSPHSTKHLRKGIFKHSEAFCTVLMEDLLDDLCEEPIIGVYKSGDIYTDPNYSNNCEYKNKLIDYIFKNNSVQYYLDFHIMASFRDTDIQLGTNNKANINNDTILLSNITTVFNDYNYSYEVDGLFKASKKDGLAVYLKNNGDTNIKTLLFEFNFNNFTDLESYNQLKSMVLRIIIDLLDT